jgi:hypothetical protein
MLEGSLEGVVWDGESRDRAELLQVFGEPENNRDGDSWTRRQQRWSQSGTEALLS